MSSVRPDEEDPPPAVIGTGPFAGWPVATETPFNKAEAQRLVGRVERASASIDAQRQQSDYMGALLFDRRLERLRAGLAVVGWIVITVCVILLTIDTRAMLEQGQLQEALQKTVHIMSNGDAASNYVVQAAATGAHMMTDVQSTVADARAAINETTVAIREAAASIRAVGSTGLNVQVG